MKNVEFIDYGESFKFLPFPIGRFKNVTRMCTEKEIDKISGALVRYLLIGKLPNFNGNDKLESIWSDVLEEVEKVIKKYKTNKNIPPKPISETPKFVPKPVKKSVKTSENVEAEYANLQTVFSGNLPF